MGKKVAKKSSKPFKDPNAPKKPLTSYMIFSNAVRKDLQRENPEAKLTEIASMTGRKWKGLDDEDKAEYNEKAAELKEAYLEAMKHYTPPANMPSQKSKKAAKDPNAPKKAMSAYFLWMNANRANLKAANPEASLPELSKLAGAEWREMDADDKVEWQQKADEDKERYAQAIAAYNGGGATNGKKKSSSKPGGSKAKKSKAEVSESENSSEESEEESE